MTAGLVTPLHPPGLGSCCCFCQPCASSPPSASSCSSSAVPLATPPWRSCSATCSRTDPLPAVTWLLLGGFWDTLRCLSPCAGTLSPPALLGAWMSPGQQPSPWGAPKWCRRVGGRGTSPGWHREDQGGHLNGCHCPQPNPEHPLHTVPAAPQRRDTTPAWGWHWGGDMWGQSCVLPSQVACSQPPYFVLQIKRAFADSLLAPFSHGLALGTLGTWGQGSQLKTRSLAPKRKPRSNTHLQTQKPEVVWPLVAHPQDATPYVPPKTSPSAPRYSSLISEGFTRPLCTATRNTPEKYYTELHFIQNNGLVAGGKGTTLINKLMRTRGRDATACRLPPALGRDKSFSFI